MSWISGNCQDDRHYSCYYETFGEWVCDGIYCDYVVESWCRDSEEPCPGYDSGGFLVNQVDNRAPSGGGW